MRAIGSVSVIALCAAGFVGASQVAMAQSSPTAAPVPAQSSPTAPAQSAPTASSSPSQGSSSSAPQLEEIVVTAQKRRENLQAVPIAITAVTASALKAAGVGGTLDLRSITPGLTMTKSGNAPLLFLRGVGTALGGTPGDEGGVNLVVDGVVYTSLPGSVFSFNNIQQIEVLRGPQGTLFGRNATGGVISITTRDPSHQPSADYEVSYGNYRTVTASGYVTGGLSDNVAADLAVQYADQQEGYGRNLANGKYVNFNRDFSIRSKLIWDIGNDTRIRFAADYGANQNDAAVAIRILPGTLGAGGQAPTGGFYDANASLQPSGALHTGGASVKIEQGLGFAQLTSISAYRKSDSGFDYDQDGGPLPLVNATFVNREQQYTEEFQIASLPSSPIKWIVGSFYLNSFAKEAPLTLSGLAFGPALFDARTGTIQTRSYAGYGQATVPLGDKTDLTGGVRYTSDNRSFVFSDISGLGIPLLPPANTSATFNRPTWRVALDHKLTSDIMAYASISTGFKAGSFNIINPLNPPIKPEDLMSYELGVKSELFDRLLRLNLSGFYYDYKNIQVAQVIQGTTFFLNAPGTIYGLDADFEARPFSHFTLSGGFELLHSEYGNFPNAPGTAPEPATCGPNGPIISPGPLTGGNITCPINAQGNQLVRAPDFTSSLTAAYTIPASIGDFGVSATYAHSSSFFFEVDNRLRQAPTDLVNGQLSWTAHDKHIALSLWVRNMTDVHYYVSQSSSLGDTGGAAAPRTFGISLGGHF